MRIGSVAGRPLPAQSQDRLLLMAERYQRAREPHAKWAEVAKRNVDFFEGRQWSEIELAAMKAQGRYPFTFNIIAPLVRLILGYQSNNKSDLKFQPSNDALSSEEVARALTQIEKVTAVAGKLPFKDTEVFMDGILTGRGFYRTILNFDTNDLGECYTRAVDPFNVFVDPDCDTYDLNESAGFVQIVRWVSLDELEHTYGSKVAENLKGFTQGKTPLAPMGSIANGEDISPMRFFGGREDASSQYWDTFYSQMGDFVDTQRKTLRIIETEHYVSEERYVAIDLETGDRQILPPGFSRESMEKIVLYGQMTGNPITIQKRRVKVPHWTTICGDMVLYDQPSRYKSFTITPFFPYFRRGQTKSPVEDLIDPQLEKNKRRTAEIEVVSKMSNGGWKYHEMSMTQAQKLRLMRYGSTPGFNLEWSGDAGMEPKQIEPGAPPMAHERLEAKSDEDIRRISGINESALGEIDKVQSGRAIEARQRQAVISLQVYLDNFKHTKELLGGKRLEMYQSFYTEQRMFRILGEDGSFSQLIINQQAQNPAGGAIQRIMNDITLGKYTCTVDEQPLAATFAGAQYEEMMAILEKLAPALGPMLPSFADLIIGGSSLPRKDEWIDRLKMMGMVPGGQPAPGQPVDPNAPQIGHNGGPPMEAPPAQQQPQAIPAG